MEHDKWYIQLFFKFQELDYDLQLIIFLTFIIFIGMVIVFSLVAYVFQAIALRRMAINRNIRHPWMGWLPLFKFYLLGVLSSPHSSKKNGYAGILITSVLIGISFVPGIFLCAAIGLFIYYYILIWRIYRIYLDNELMHFIIAITTPPYAPILLFAKRKTRMKESIGEGTKK